MLFPSIICESIPYESPLSAKFSIAYCSFTGVDNPYPLFSIQNITGKSHVEAKFNAS